MKIRKNISKIASTALVLTLTGACAVAAYAKPAGETALRILR